MRPSRLVTLLLVALAVTGCVRGPGPRMSTAATAPPVVAHPAPVMMAPEPEGPYRLDSGDKLRVVVFGQEGLTNSYAVDANGSITMPLIAGVPARGATTAELAGAIGARLRQGFVREPHVAVEIEAYRPFFILGEVMFPGQYPYVAHMTVETAVAIAGGFSPRAYRSKVQITRTMDGMQTRGPAPLPTPVQPGDTINVAERWF